MFWYLVRLSTGALSGGLYASPLEMAIQSAVACSEAKDGCLLVSWQLMECVLFWVVSSSFAVENGFLFITDKSFVFSVGQMITLRIARVKSSSCNNNNQLIHSAYKASCGLFSEGNRWTSWRTLTCAQHRQLEAMLT